MADWSEHAGGCPIPSTHDRLQEAHWFLHQMQEHYHDPALFRYSLAAFLNAARSITWLLQKELRHQESFDSWYGSIQLELRADHDLVTLNALRVRVTKMESLLPESTARIAHLKHRSDRLSMSMPAAPTERSVELLLRARNVGLIAGHPQRAWIGEEVAVLRRWSLPDVGGRDLVAYSIDCWRKLAGVVSRAHEFCGAPGVPEETCAHLQTEYAVLTESEVFPELVAVWEGETPVAIRPKSGELVFRSGFEAPDDVLHSLNEGVGAALGWVGPRFQSTPFNSVLLLSLNSEYLTKNTAALFDASNAVVTPADVSELPREYHRRV